MATVTTRHPLSTTATLADATDTNGDKFASRGGGQSKGGLVENIHLYAISVPANTKHLYNICTMLDQRRRRWANVVQMLCKCFVFAGLAVYTR